MDRDQRSEELNNLRLALATFALQLDAFEARLKSRSFKANLRPFKPAAAPDIGLAKQNRLGNEER